MKWAILLVFIVQTLASPSTEPTTIQIHNYDGPILLHIPAQNDETCQNYPSYPQAEIQCTCIAKPSIKYVPINTVSESSCCNRRNYGVYSENGGSCTCGSRNSGSCTCGNNCGSCTCVTHCGTCNCGTNSGNCGGVCSCGSNGKHCRTCTCDTNTSENSGTYKCGKCGGPCTYEANNSGSCTCGSRNSESCTCGSNNSGSCTCGTTNSEYNGESQFYSERRYKGIDKISYALDIVKPRTYESDYNNCICHKCPCY